MDPDGEKRESLLDHKENKSMSKTKPFFFEISGNSEAQSSDIHFVSHILLNSFKEDLNVNFRRPNIYRAQKEKYVGNDCAKNLSSKSFTDKENNIIFEGIFNRIRQGNSAFNDIDSFCESNLLGSNKNYSSFEKLIEKWPILKNRKKINLMINDPDSSICAWYVSIFIMLLITFSSFSILLESLPVFNIQKEKYSFKVIDICCTVLFTMEYLLNLLTTDDLLSFFKDFLNIVDLIAILPFYIEISISTSFGTCCVGAPRILRSLRLTRILRLMKLGSKIEKLEVVWVAVKKSSDMLMMLIFLTMLALILFSSLMYFAEKESNDGFKSIPATFWWCIVTLITIGYGDLVPVTPAGQFVACITMVTSLVITALPISVISASFSQEWCDYLQREKDKARTCEVWKNFCKLTEELEIYNRVMEDLLLSMENAMKCLDHGILYIITNSEELKASIKIYREGRGSAMQKLKIEQKFAELSEDMKSVKVMWKGLSQLLEISRSAKNQDFVNNIDLMIFAYKKLEISYKEGKDLISGIKNLEKKIIKNPQS